MHHNQGIYTFSSQIQAFSCSSLQQLIHIYIHIQDKSDIIVLLKCDSILQKGG